ncbi:unnamed protein product [Brassica oleracea]
MAPWMRCRVWVGSSTVTVDELALLLNNQLVFPSPLLYTVASSHSRRPSTAGIIHPLRFTI